MQKLVLVFTLALLQPTIRAEEAKGFERGCDIPSATTRSISQSSFEACKEACNSDVSCKASVFVSGWKRCFLKAQPKPKHQIEFISANKDDVSLAYGYDNSGKDIKKYNFENVEACQDECKKNPACGGFTYIKGYKNCWLKSAGGNLYQKTFFCYLKR